MNSQHIADTKRMFTKLFYRWEKLKHLEIVTQILQLVTIGSTLETKSIFNVDFSVVNYLSNNMLKKIFLNPLKHVSGAGSF